MWRALPLPFAGTRPKGGSGRQVARLWALAPKVRVIAGKSAEVQSIDQESLQLID
ncbi:hypothetical protein [Accumulibacter sp.]|uniref:hypothetical protein n=1 Tax=Accumulibacter sp. TaxID=2053492 RepID=UPI001AC112C2|nr:hypothetical protein [Accumulibacter sp.]MBN8455870.1 hypothetical protein [Accumulibacter sp.]MBO3708810.1 hypothetical protein [Candidatus Accumulibacter conexus]